MRKSIVVVDDDEIYKIIIGKMIKNNALFEKDYLFTDPREALEFCLKKELIPDVILLDLNMPHIDGWEFLDNLKSKCHEMCTHSDIYIVTSSIFTNDRERAENYKEVKGFISKPITKEILDKIASGK